jgi:nucleoside 2-deoxyribosyltransferase
MKIYLAIPYTGHEEQSFKEANRIAGILMRRGHIVMSPISMTHSIAKEGGLPQEWEFWEKNDSAFIEWCDQVWIANFGNWRRSRGVTAEIQIAINLKKQIRFLPGM